MRTIRTLVATTALLTTVSVGATQWAAPSATGPAAATDGAVPTGMPRVDAASPPAQSPPAQSPPAQSPPAQSPPAEEPTGRRPAPPVDKGTAPAPAPDGPTDDHVLLRPGDEGPEVRDLQARLRQIAWFTGDVTDYFGELTEAAVAGFQAKRGFPATGLVDERTLSRLEEMTVEPTADELANVEPAVTEGAPLDPRCLVGRVLCVDKSSSSLRWVVDGDVEATMDARFGGNGYVTREGDFTVTRKSRDHVSSIYGTSMPFAMFFDGGRAVHYSPDFAAVGYAGASHGCVNIRDYAGIAALYDEVEIGDRVVVYWS